MWFHSYQHLQAVCVCILSVVNLWRPLSALKCTDRKMVKGGRGPAEERREEEEEEEEEMEVAVGLRAHTHTHTEV